MAKGSTAIEGLSGKERTGGGAGGIDADGAGGRSDRCCTSTIVPIIIATPASESAPRRTNVRACQFVEARCGSPSLGSNPEYSHRFGYILDPLLADVGVAQCELVLDLRVNGIRDANAVGVGETLEARCDVDTVAIDLVAFDHHIAEVNADSKSGAREEYFRSLF